MFAYGTPQRKTRSVGQLKVTERGRLQAASLVPFLARQLAVGREKPVTVPERMNVPSGDVKVLSAAGSWQVTAFAGWCAFADVSVSTSGAPPPEGVNENVRLKALGMKTDVLPITWAGVKVPFPLTTTES
jgi:hypothetical protein